jgi:hypothetical protein
MSCDFVSSVWRPQAQSRLPADPCELIAEMAAANRTWGEERAKYNHRCDERRQRDDQQRQLRTSADLAG